MSTWNVKKGWKGNGMQLLELNLSNITLMHEINFFLFKKNKNDNVNSQ